MPRLAANLTMMYAEHAFLDRFQAAAQDGFTGVEFLFPYEFAAADLKARLADNGLTQALFNAPPGDWGAGRTRHRVLARAGKRVPVWGGAGAGVRRPVGQSQPACDGRPDPAGRGPRGAP